MCLRQRGETLVFEVGPLGVFAPAWGNTKKPSVFAPAWRNTKKRNAVDQAKIKTKEKRSKAKSRLYKIWE